MKQKIFQTWSALVNSGNIRYTALPVASVAIADDAAWDQLFAAGGAPAVDYWLCGFVFSIATGLVVAENTMLFDVGWGGADGAAVAAANVVVTNWPVSFSAVAVALGPFECEAQMLPLPVRIPGASRMAARIAASPIGGVAVTEFRVILATAVV
jgi:hypothetical protein